MNVPLLTTFRDRHVRSFGTTTPPVNVDRLQFSTPGIVGCQCSLPPLFVKEHAAPMIVDLILVSCIVSSA
ncbi:hypothetical protein CC2G_007027 [Coprinopsis cinerea AmutBmut pab1-1]|nr:hypothetical protein CC2G_007027 [Coprinopsis cinerea AmutBmut pab1-1]